MYIFWELVLILDEVLGSPQVSGDHFFDKAVEVYLTFPSEHSFSFCRVTEE